MDDLGYNDIGIQTYPTVDHYYPNAGPEPNPNRIEPNLPDPNEARLLTPVIDSLAEQGLRMTDFYTARLCSPARAALLTGRYASRQSINAVFFPNSDTGMNTAEVTLPEQLRELGYSTGMAGKWHLGYNKSQTLSFQMMPTRHGFQEFFGIPYSNDMANLDLIDGEEMVQPDLGTGENNQTRLTWQLTERALNFLERKTAEDKPFFLYFAHPMTHIPCWPSNQEFENADGTIWPKFKGSSGVSYYYDVVKEVDHSVHRIMMKLEELTIDENTLVIFTSDNGPWLNLSNIDQTARSVGSAYPLKDGKFTTWEGGVRVPFMARWPGRIPPGSVSDQLSGVVDILPTLVALAGGSPRSDRTIDGLDMMPVWSGEVNSINRGYAMFSGGSPQAVRIGNWKLGSGNLYNLENDIQELNDVSGLSENASILNELRNYRGNLQTSVNNERIPLGVYSNYKVVFSANDVKVPKGQSATVDIRLSHNPGATRVVRLDYFSGNTDLSVSNGASLTFTTANWSDWQTVTLSSAPNGDWGNGGATFRATLDNLNVVRELFVFETDSEDAATITSHLIWPKIDSLMIENTEVKLLAEGTLKLDGIANPEGSTYWWVKVSGPGPVSFTDPTAARTGVLFTDEGEYTLRFHANHPSAGQFDTEEFRVRVGTGAATPAEYRDSPELAYDANTSLSAKIETINQAPTISAGEDLSVAYTDVVKLTATASDDGVPSDGALAVHWVAVSGPNQPAFDDTSLLLPTVDFTMPGDYKLRLEVDDGEIKVYDVMQVTVAPFTYSEWESTIEFPEDQNAPGDNPDGDQWPNAWEWLFGSDPLVPSSNNSYLGRVDANEDDTMRLSLEFEFPRNREPVIMLQGTKALDFPWVDLSSVSPEVEVIDADTVRWTYRLDLDRAIFGKYFLRTKIDL